MYEGDTQDALFILNSHPRSLTEYEKSPVKIGLKFEDFNSLKRSKTFRQSPPLFVKIKNVRLTIRTLPLTKVSGASAKEIGSRI